ncbi:transcriptional repressor [Oscillibacter sp. MSJ-2]|uniref:Transcriptional repressor n=1 Tax=Dysosmobacter acutus TaxID=2841504 RepID=A0ABS6F4V9_9FIRM|nr:transcriptional repressor [Dysosmobacter acutus]MBU5625322.1 transcriptional repressor [Dysosmobacter acutus]
MRPQRYSARRERIYESVAASCEHPSAEMIYNQLKSELPQLSLGTVYRNLNQLAEEGRLSRLDSGSADRFDATVAPHTHFCCTACGRVLDLPVPYDPALDREAERWGCKVKGHSLTFLGICSGCGGKNTVL